MYLGKYHISLRCIQIVQIIFLYFNSLGLYSSDIYLYMSPLRFFCQSDEFISSWPLLCEDCGVPFAYFMNIKWHIRCRACLIHGPQMTKMKENRNTNEYICRTHKKCDTQKKGTIQMFRPHTSCTNMNRFWGNPVYFWSYFGQSLDLFCLNRFLRKVYFWSYFGQSLHLFWTDFEEKAAIRKLE